MTWIPASAGMTDFEMFDLYPSATPSSGGITGVFGNHLSELRNKPRFVWLVRASLIAPMMASSAGDVKRQRGALFFGYFLVGKHKKVARESGETDTETYGAMPCSYCALHAIRPSRLVRAGHRQNILPFQVSTARRLATDGDRLRQPPLIEQ